jgi:hypothetical protein
VSDQGKDLSREDLLRLFQSKARCHRTQRRAHQLWKLLLPDLTHGQTRELGLAWVHALSDSCDPAELDLVCARIFAAWGKNA